MSGCYEVPITEGMIDDSGTSEVALIFAIAIAIVTGAVDWPCLGMSVLVVQYSP